MIAITRFKLAAYTATVVYWGSSDWWKGVWCGLLMYVWLYLTEVGIPPKTPPTP